MGHVAPILAVKAPGYSNKTARDRALEAHIAN